MPPSIGEEREESGWCVVWVSKYWKLAWLCAKMEEMFHFESHQWTILTFSFSFADYCIAFFPNILSLSSAVESLLLLLANVSTLIRYAAAPSLSHILCVLSLFFYNFVDCPYFIAECFAKQQTENHFVYFQNERNFSFWQSLRANRAHTSIHKEAEELPFHVPSMLLCLSGFLSLV